MWLREIRVPSFAAGSELHLPLADEAGAPVRWTVVLGDSGAGKTRLLQAIATAELERPVHPGSFLAAFGCSRAHSISEAGGVDPLTTLLLATPLPLSWVARRFAPVERKLERFAQTGRSRPLTWHGNGRAGFNAMVRAIAAAAWDSADHAGPGIVLIDEIELHLTVLQQREVRSFLTTLFPTAQFVVTTHSPVIAHETHPGELVQLVRRGERVRLVRHPVHAARLRLPQLLESPLFGMATMESHDTHSRRKELRRLQRRVRRSAAAEQRLVELRQNLLSARGRDASTRRRERLFHRIDRHLAARGKP